MTAPADTLADLRRALADGAWQRLNDPRLDLMRLERPKAWPNLVEACARALSLDALADDPEAHERVVAWARSLAPDGRVSSLRMSDPSESVPLFLLLDHLRAFQAHLPLASLLTLTRQAVARYPSPEREAALSLLERWPVE